MTKSDEDRQLSKTINYKTYLAIAWKSFFKVQDLCKKRKNVTELTDQDINEICYYNAEIQRLSISTIIFCLMTLESFINHYGSISLSKSYFEKYLDKLNLKSKWVIIPRLVTGKQIEADSKSFNYLLDLITLRNNLVHNKPIMGNEYPPKGSDWLWETDTFKALECVELIMNELKKIDNEVEIDWIEESKNNLYV